MRQGLLWLSERQGMFNFVRRNGLARRFASMAEQVRAREERLQHEVRELRIEIDQVRQARRVAEITDTDFFRDLRSRAGDLRREVREVREAGGAGA